MAASIASQEMAARLAGATRARRRAVVNATMRTVALVVTLLCVVPLGSVLVFVTVNGAPALTVQLLTEAPRALGKGGALNAITGTLQMVPLATLIAVPIGIAGAVYISEFASPGVARVVRFAADVLVGVPSILIGLFVFTFLVLPFQQFNAFAGSVALAVIMIPVVLRTTEEILNLVPRTLREASLALGIPVWRTVLSVVIPTGLEIGRAHV